jgi:hypothetical protein
LMRPYWQLKFLPQWSKQTYNMPIWRVSCSHLVLCIKWQHIKRPLPPWRWHNFATTSRNPHLCVYLCLWSNLIMGECAVCTLTFLSVVVENAIQSPFLAAYSVCLYQYINKQ